MLLSMPTHAVVVWTMVTLVVKSLAEAEETCTKGDPTCGSVHHDQYSKEANVDKFEVH